MSKKIIQSDVSKKFANPEAIIEQIENASAGNPPDDPYRTRIEDIMGLLLRKLGDVDEAEDAEHLRETSGGMVLEEAARHTGFILGFEYCRDLMLSSGAATTGGGR